MADFIFLLAAFSHSTTIILLFSRCGVFEWIVGSRTEEEKHLFYDDDLGLLSQNKKYILVIEHEINRNRGAFSKGEKLFGNFEFGQVSS